MLRYVALLWALCTPLIQSTNRLEVTRIHHICLHSMLCTFVYHISIMRKQRNTIASILLHRKNNLILNSKLIRWHVFWQCHGRISVSTSIMYSLNLDALIRPLWVENMRLNSDVAIGMPAQKQNWWRRWSIRLEVLEKLTLFTQIMLLMDIELNVEWRWWRMLERCAGWSSSAKFGDRMTSSGILVIKTFGWGMFRVWQSLSPFLSISHNEGHHHAPWWVPLNMTME